MDIQEVKIESEFIKVVAFLKYAGVCSTGGEASVRIENGDIAVNGDRCFMRGKKLHRGDVVSVAGKAFRVV